MSKVIRIVPYRASWPDTYAKQAALLRGVVPAGAQLHHIGSTAVPGLAAKDVIDLQLTVDSLDSVVAANLARAGFVEKPGRMDHCPPGMVLPQPELTKRYFCAESPAAHLHVREGGRFHQRYALLFRDYLRADPAAMAAYQAIKIALAERTGGDPAAYYALKDPVCDAIKAGAEQWARLTAWKQPAAD